MPDGGMMEKSHSAINWSELFASREKIHRRYPTVWDIPLIKKRTHLLRQIIGNGMRVLDVGAGRKGLKDDLVKMGLEVGYRSLDVDQSIEHDFYDIDEIKEVFDVAVLFEVIEHLSLEEGFELLQKIRFRLREGGLLIVSTPNIFNPSRFFRDASHRTFYAYDELAGLLSMAGFDISRLCRSYNDAFHRYLLKVYLLPFLFRFFSIDFAYSIFAVAEKRETGGPHTEVHSKAH